MGIGNIRTSLAALVVALGAGCGGTPAKMTPDMAGSGGGIGGNAFLVNVLTKANVNGSMMPVRELNTVVGFSPIGKGHKPDYDDRQGLFGCSASHLTNGQSLGSDSDAGTVSINMYGAANFLDGTAAPAEINCARVIDGHGDNVYKCGYGPLVGGMPGTAMTHPYPADAQLLKDQQVVHYKLAGGADVGAIDTGTMITGVDMPTVVENLETIKYDPTQDTTIHISCPSETCGYITAINITASPNSVANFDQPAATTGLLTCANLSNNTVTIKKEAIAAMFANDASLVTVKTSVARLGLPTGLSDNKGNTMQFAAGAGVIAFAPR
jgi:hypothetical protein